MGGREAARPCEESFHLSLMERSRSRFDLYINVPFGRQQFDIFIVLNHDGLQVGMAFEQASASKKVLVQKATVRCLNVAPLACIQNIEGRWVRRHTWTLAQRPERFHTVIAPCSHGRSTSHGPFDLPVSESSDIRKCSRSYTVAIGLRIGAQVSEGIYSPTF